MYKDKETSILGVHINNWELDTFVSKVNKALGQEGSPISIITPNPEITLRAYNDQSYKKILNAADVSLPDGIGLRFANILLQKKILRRITGVMATKIILDQANKSGASVLWVLRKNSLSTPDDVIAFIQNTYPKITIDVITSTGDTTDITTHIKSKPADIVFLALGAPLQEINVQNLCSRNVGVKVAMANGGAIDFFTKKIKHAPLMLRYLGLEWLWRLAIEPRYRYRRIFNAVIIFPLIVLKWKLRSLFIYRKNAIGCIINNDGDILITHFKPYNQWGIPQGGIDSGEGIAEAAIREMGEEVGIPAKMLSVIKVQKNIYSYKWKPFYRLIRGYKGQSQSVVYLQFSGNDHDIHVDNIEIDTWKWVKREELIVNISNVRQESAKQVVRYLPKQK